MLDGLDDILGFVVFIIWILIQVGAAMKKKQAGAPAPTTAPSRPKRARAQAPARAVVAASPARTAAPAAPAGRATVHVTAPPAAAAADPLEGALVRLEQETARMLGELDRLGRIGVALSDTLRTSVQEPLEQVATRWREVLRLVALGGRVPNLSSHADVTMRWTRELARRLGIVRRLAEARAHARDDAGIDDADAIAASFVRPLADFARVQGIEFPQSPPIAVPVRPGAGDEWTTAVPDHAVIGVPLNFADDLFWWTSVPHAFAHLIWDRVPGLADEMVSTLGLQGTTQLHEPAYQPAQDLPHRLVRAWAPEVFADAITVLLAGPAAVHGMMHAFDDPRVPVRLVDVAARPDGTYDPHPPAAVRVLVAIRLLTRFGFDAEATQMSRVWHARHPDAATLVVPISRGRAMSYGADALAEYVARWAEAMCTEQFDALAGHAFEHVPGFALSPGLWRRVREDAAALEFEGAFHDDPRLVVTAAIEARHHNPGAAAAIRRAARAAIVGAHAPLSDRRVERARRGQGARTGRFSRAEIRDALVLVDVAERRTGVRRSRPPRLSGRPGV